MPTPMNAELKCAKCGSVDIATVYHEHLGPCMLGVSKKDYHSHRGPQHLHYSCRTCGWDWTGATVEQREKVKGDA